MFKKKTLTDEDIEKLFENNDSSVIENDSKEESKNQSKEIEIALTSDLFLPDEMNASKDRETKRIPRPQYEASDEFKEKKKLKLKEKEIIDNINKTKSIDVLQKTDIRSMDVFNAVATTVNTLKNNERLRELEKQKLLNSGKYNFDPSTQCTFHVYQPRDLMGNIVYCACKYCSAYKEMTMEQWKQYQLTIKKYL